MITTVVATEVVDEADAGVVTPGAVVLANGTLVEFWYGAVVLVDGADVDGDVVFANGAVEFDIVALVLSIRSVTFLKGESSLDGGGMVPGPSVQFPPGTFSVCPNISLSQSRPGLTFWRSGYGIPSFWAIM